MLTQFENFEIENPNYIIGGFIIEDDLEGI